MCIRGKSEDGDDVDDPDDFDPYQLDLDWAVGVMMVYGHQPYSEIRDMTVEELLRLSEAVLRIIKRENRLHFGPLRS